LDTTGGKKKKPKHFRLQEQVEWIAMAFVLALTVRCFVVEAYEIPTGSMAPTLYGSHFEVTCGSCGARFAVNAGQHGEYPSDFLCPACGASGPAAAGSVRLYGGDRILVSKDYYLFTEPRRWEVFVFKSVEPGKQNTNFVKRLIGLPGERVDVRNGQIFINGEIARKPGRVQEELWQGVYDGLNADRAAGYWRASSGWEARPEGLLLSEASQAWQAIQYDKPILDFYVYNGREGDNVVGDILVQGHLNSEGPSGSLAVLITNEEGTWKAVFSPMGPVLSVELRLNEHLVDKASPRISSERDFDFRFSVADAGQQVRVNGMTVIDHQTELTLDQAPKYTEASGVAFEGQGSQMLVSQVIIKRDVYYTLAILRPDRDPSVRPYGTDVAEGHYLGMGDNSPISSDSRWWGQVPEENVLGKAFFVFWPPTRVGPVF